MDRTTIQITKEDEERLDQLKTHPAQPMREVIEAILDDRERGEIIEKIIKAHPKFYAELSDLKGKRKEELFKRLSE